MRSWPRSRGGSVEAAIRALEHRPDVEYASPNSKRHARAFADEPLFSNLWGLHNTGQTVNGFAGTPNVDINGKEASVVSQGASSVVVAVIDDGVDFTHPDLAGRQWVNRGESGLDAAGKNKATNGVDDDANGYVDDVNGWDFCRNDKTVHDDGEDFHGTHVAGTIAASVNGQGIVGVAPNVKIMALKFLCGDGAGTVEDEIEALAYAKKMGAKISNASFGDYAAPNSAEKSAIDNSGQLFVAAVGEIGWNNDFHVNPGDYPASYTSPNILSVASIHNAGELSAFSHYGAESVDISAPGEDILSAIPKVNRVPAATLSSVGTSGGKALTAGFGAEEISDATKRSSFFTKAFQAVGRGSQAVVLVDDDWNTADGQSDVGPTLSAAIQSATGSTPQEIDVAPSDANGPPLSQLQGKTVVWATGRAYRPYTDCSSELTAADQTTLTEFLNGGGRLVITGMNSLRGLEECPFVDKTLGLWVADSGISAPLTFTGDPGTLFAGESYVLNSDFPSLHARVGSKSTAAQTLGGYRQGTPAKWQFYSGTSMATPHATGTAALLASKYPALLSKSTELKQVVMDHGKPLPATAGKTLTGKMPDVNAVLTKPTVTFPTPSYSTTDRTPTISAIVKDFQTDLTKSNVTLTLAGVSKTSSATYNTTTDKLSYTPTTNLALTTYKVEVTAKDASGNSVYRMWWIKIVA